MSERESTPLNLGFFSTCYYFFLLPAAFSPTRSSLGVAAYMREKKVRDRGDEYLLS